MDTVHLEKLNELHEVIERRTISRFQEIADNAQTIDKTEICETTTFYIHDTSHWDTDYNSIVFDAHRGLHKTKKTTKQLINKFARSKEANFMLMQAMGRQLEVKRCWPYVLGNVQFVPTSGATYTSTNWIAVHHLKDAYQDVEDPKRLYLLFNEGMRLNVRIDLKHLERKLTTVRKYYDFQVSLAKFLGKQFTTEFVAPQANSYLFTRIPKTAELPATEYQNCREILIRILFQVYKTMSPEDRIRLDDMESLYKDMLKERSML
ncbi:Hypothetical protein ADU72_0885 [Pediococcus damnosus]|uniref:ComK protein n=1 Tax=Pediococcus damnosus TaxID=51663 RepID=A0A0R2HL37_9LACO|nr:competence protein ComK [Pediococcus damnosus]AMV63276.1 Hypothetical protein ADU70_1808 [Pediococcus damnosus]AMV66828.1 Hypothetical protein ADU72_0885 [Pediococcus damnosus]AMV69809.1 Hypothetical protein ADU73_1413 [Pediococcus damnosus]KJU74192.1 hypothetical protein AH70_08095 [Pediococcus damnosus LMG 28219]KRN53198.1 hypothetical protein IV84_GL000422 [Pediococcus damnosus]